MSLHTKVKKMITGSLVVFTALAGFYLSVNFSLGAYADDTKSVTASVVVPDVCTLSSSSTTHTDSVNGGTYTPNFGGESTVSVTCNDRNGYSVYAVGYSNDTEGNNTLIGSYATIPTGTSTSTSVSNWAMKLTAVSGTYTPTILSDASGSFSNYHTVPSTATKVATYASDINVSATSQFKTAYAVSIAPSQTADTYTGKVKYTVVHPNYTNADGTRETYNIPVNFAGSGVSSVTFTASGYPTRTVSTSGGTANLTAAVEYTVTATLNSGYELESWTLNNASYGTLGSTSANPTTFTPNASSGSAIITATGVKPKLWFQNATIAQCGQTMYDNRGTDAYKNVAYTTAMIGSLCWMTRNLDLPGGTTLSSADTNVPDNYSTTTSGFTNGNTLPASSTSGFSNYDTAYVYNSGRTTCSSNSSTGSCYSYYSWRAATAGYDATSNGTSVSYDICPKGWRLPTQAELTTLKSSYSTGATLTASPFLGVYAGYYDPSSFYNGGSYGSYWSSTSYYGGNAYTMYYFSSGSAGVSSSSKGFGRSVRCVAKS